MQLFSFLVESSSLLFLELKEQLAGDNCAVLAATADVGIEFGCTGKGVRRLLQTPRELIWVGHLRVLSMSWQILCESLRSCSPWILAIFDLQAQVPALVHAFLNDLEFLALIVDLTGHYILDTQIYLVILLRVKFVIWNNRTEVAAVSELWQPAIVVSSARTDLRLLYIDTLPYFDIKISSTQVSAIVDDFRPLCLALQFFIALFCSLSVYLSVMFLVFSSRVGETIPSARHRHHGFLTEEDHRGSVIVVCNLRAVWIHYREWTIFVVISRHGSRWP